MVIYDRDASSKPSTQANSSIQQQTITRRSALSLRTGSASSSSSGRSTPANGSAFMTALPMSPSPSSSRQNSRQGRVSTARSSLSSASSSQHALLSRRSGSGSRPLSSSSSTSSSSLGLLQGSLLNITEDDDIDVEDGVVLGQQSLEIGEEDDEVILDTNRRSSRMDINNFQDEFLYQSVTTEDSAGIEDESHDASEEQIANDENPIPENQQRQFSDFDDEEDEEEISSGNDSDDKTAEGQSQPPNTDDLRLLEQDDDDDDEPAADLSALADTFLTRLPLSEQPSMISDISRPETVDSVASVQTTGTALIDMLENRVDDFLAHQEATKKYLESFISDIKNRTTEEGDQVVEFPKNYDDMLEIAAANIRDSIASASEGLWDLVTAPSGMSEEEAMKEFNPQTDSVEVGLQKIMMLEIKLEKLLHKAAISAKEARQITEKDKKYLEERKKSKINLRRQLQAEFQAIMDGKNSDDQQQKATDATPQLDSSKSQNFSSMSVAAAAASAFNTSQGPSSAREGKSLHSNSDNKSTSFIERNRILGASARYYSLTDEEQKRVAEILDDPVLESFDTMPPGHGYAPAQEEIDRISEINEKLRSILPESEWEGYDVSSNDISWISGAQPQNDESASSASSSRAARTGKTSGIDYLREQREDRRLRTQQKEVNEKLAQLCQEENRPVQPMPKEELRKLIDEAMQEQIRLGYIPSSTEVTHAEIAEVIQDEEAKDEQLEEIADDSEEDEELMALLADRDPNAPKSTYVDSDDDEDLAIE